MTTSIKPLKLGVRFDPAAIVLVYLEENSKKLHCRTIPVRNIDILTDINAYTKKFLLNDKYKKYFSRIKEKSLEKMLFILQDHMKGYTVKESLSRLNKTQSTQAAMNKKTNIDEDDDDIEEIEDDFSKGKIQAYKDEDDDDDDFSF